MAVWGKEEASRPFPEASPQGRASVGLQFRWKARAGHDEGSSFTNSEGGAAAPHAQGQPVSAALNPPARVVRTLVVCENRQTNPNFGDLGGSAPRLPPVAGVRPAFAHLCACITLRSELGSPSFPS